MARYVETAPDMLGSRGQNHPQLVDAKRESEDAHAPQSGAKLYRAMAPPKREIDTPSSTSSSQHSEIHPTPTIAGFVRYSSINLAGTLVTDQTRLLMVQGGTFGGRGSGLNVGPTTQESSAGSAE